MAVKYNGTYYYYATNAFGDVVAIADGAGNEVVTYTYDAWGNILSTGGTMASTLGAHNPFRYRGYVYDQETGLYYLQSRYYNPTIGRFISADSISYLGADGTPQSYNLFAYCKNNPVMYIDPAGTLAFPGEIHNEVVKRIANSKGYFREQKIEYANGKWGRADLISFDGQVWDVKRDKPSQIEAGKKQVTHYVENIWAQFPDTELKVGGDQGFSGFFYHKSGLITYKVSYRYAGGGVIAYDYRVSEFDYQTLAATVLTLGITVLLFLLGVPGVSGATGGAGVPA